MRAILWKDIDTIELEDVQAPTPGENEALIKVTHAGICGSDLTIVSGKHPRAKTPLIPGHEFTGRIESLPTGHDTDLQLGQRVTVEPLLSCKQCKPCKNGNEHVCKNLKLLGVETDGGFAEYVAAPLEKVYPLPDSISDQEAALMEPLSVAVHGYNYGQISEDDTVVIFGAGPIGLLIAQVTRAYGVSNIWLCEISPFRIKMAKDLGFDVIDTSKEDPVEKIMSITDGDGADVTFDAAGVPAVCQYIIPITGIKGRIVMTAIHKKPCEIFLRDISYREQMIFGTRIYAEGDYKQAIKLAADGKVSLPPLITGVFPLEQARDAFALAKQPDRSCKVLLEV
jgi:2-desacetyl-2-hydroxyethyl bacteriochlorophyllide A dehydrogenase